MTSTQLFICVIYINDFIIIIVLVIMTDVRRAQVNIFIIWLSLIRSRAVSALFPWVHNKIGCVFKEC